MTAGRCRFCGRPVRFATGRNRKPVPFNPTPHPDGQFILHAGRAWYPHELRAKGEPWSDWADAVPHVLHPTTCPSWPRPEPAKPRPTAQGHLACMACGVIDATVRHTEVGDRCRTCRASEPVAKLEAAPEPAPGAEVLRLHTRPNLADLRHTQAEARAARDLTRLEADYRAGTAVAYPDRITFALDAADLYGPEVDIACRAKEPAVDQWEAGAAAPSWEQLVALAELTGFTPAFFTRPLTVKLGPVFMCGENTAEVVPPRTPVPPYRPPAPVVPIGGPR